MAFICYCYRLFIREEQLSPNVLEHLCVGKKGGVKTFPYEAVSSHLSQLVGSVEGKVWLSGMASHALYSIVPSAKKRDILSPIQLLKAVKNETEIQGMKYSHVSCFYHSYRARVGQN